MQQLDPAALRAAMVASVMTDDDVARRWSAALAPWRPALADVPRHKFVPFTIWVRNPADDGPTYVRLRRDDDPAGWLRHAYGGGEDPYVVTQIDDGYQPGGSMPTSSASGPVIVAVMLAALDAQPGERVLEIGTGTGYNAALLAHRLGADQVTTIEVDPVVSERARQALKVTGYRDVRAVVGDGAAGYPPGAPYDRVIATAAVRDIPHAWIAQTHPGGRVLLPWSNSYTGALVALTVDGGQLASGSIVGEASFMWLRDQRERRGAVAEIVGDEDRAECSVTDLHPYWLSGDQGSRFAIGQRVPACQWRYWSYDAERGTGVWWLLDFGSGSWAKLTHCTPDGAEDAFPVRQHGPRRLFDEVTAAYRWWVDAGRPGVDRWVFTVTPDGQRIELAG